MTFTDVRCCRGRKNWRGTQRFYKQIRQLEELGRIPRIEAERLLCSTLMRSAVELKFSPRY